MLEDVFLFKFWSFSDNIIVTQKTDIPSWIPDSGAIVTSTGYPRKYESFNNNLITSYKDL